MLKTQLSGWFDFGINCLHHILLKLLQHFVGAIRRIAYQVDRTWDPFSVVDYCVQIPDQQEDGFLISWSCWSRARYDFLRCQCRKRESCEVTLVVGKQIADRVPLHGGNQPSIVSRLTFDCELVD